MARQLQEAGEQAAAVDRLLVPGPADKLLASAERGGVGTPPPRRPAAASQSPGSRAGLSASPLPAPTAEALGGPRCSGEAASELALIDQEIHHLQRALEVAAAQAREMQPTYSTS